MTCGLAASALDSRAFTSVSHDAGLRQIDLVEHDEGVDVLDHVIQTRRASSASISGGVGVQFLESRRFNSRGGWPGSITRGLQ